MKLLYPEIDTWVYNTPQTDPSINMLPVSLSHLGMLKTSRVASSPAQKAVTTYEGDQTTTSLCHFWRSNGLTCKFPFQMLFLNSGLASLHETSLTRREARANKHNSSDTSPHRRDYPVFPPHSHTRHFQPWQFFLRVTPAILSSSH